MILIKKRYIIFLLLFFQLLSLNIANSKRYNEKSIGKIIKSCKLKKFVIKKGDFVKIAKGAALTLDIPIEIEPGGTLEFEENTLAWINKITLMGAGSNLVLNYSNTGDVILIPAETRTGKVILNNGSTLSVKTGENDKPIALIGGIDVNAGATFTVEESANLDLGEFKILCEFVNIPHPFENLPKGEMNIKGKTHIRLFGKNNYVYGNLNTPSVIQNGNEPEIKGFKGQNPYKCNSNEFVFSKIQIIDLDLNIQNTKFYNVSFQVGRCVFGKGSKNYFENCYFSYNSNDYVDHNDRKKPNSFISVFAHQIFIGRSCFGEPSPLISNKNELTITNCTFKDESLNQVPDRTAAIPWLTTENEKDPTKLHHISGVYAQGLSSVIIDNSGLAPLPENFDFDSFDAPVNHHFMGLNSGVTTVNCGRVEINNSNFAYCRNMNTDQNSSVKLCQNTTFRVNTPHALNCSKFWSSFDNRFFQSNKSVSLMGVLSGQNFRGNLFDDYYNGIFLNNSRAYLRGRETAPNSTTIFKMGRNEFKIPKLEGSGSIQPYPDNLLQNPFAVTEPINKYNSFSRSDIFFINYNIQTEFEYRKPLKIQCGYNKMGEYTPSHLFYDKQGNSSLPNINVVPNYNNWRGTIPIRLTNVTLENPQSNLINGQNRYSGCNEDITEEQCEQLVPIVHPCDFFVRNNGIWPQCADTSAILDNDFYATFNDFCNGVLSCECYRIRLFDLVQLAVLGDSTDAKLQMLTDCVLDLIDDYVFVNSNCQAVDLMMSLGEAYERKGLFDLALDVYYYTLFNSYNSADTTIARWRIMNLEAMQADSTFGGVYDSLMADYLNRVDYDITKMSYDDGGGEPAPRIVIKDKKAIKSDDNQPIAELEQNSPNPFTNETVIRFRLNHEADVRLAIHDISGQTIMVIVNQHLNPGNYIYTYINEGLGAGVYLYLLTTDGRQFSKKMQLNK